VNVHLKNETELKTIAAGNQLLSKCELPFALNQTPRAGNLRRREQFFSSVRFVLPRALRDASARSFHQRPKLRSSCRLGAGK
jgi:hypothetical protein